MNPSQDTELLLAFLANELAEDQFSETVQRLRSEPALVQQLLALSADEELLREWAANPPEEQERGEIEYVYLNDPKPRPKRSILSKWTILSLAVALLILVLPLSWWLSLAPAVARVHHGAGNAPQELGWGWRTVRLGESLQFSAGVIELTTTQGVKLVIEGPCDCRFDSAETLYLAAGKLFADVPKSGHGFQVKTPDGEVVDWGTKFGIEVAGNRPTEVHVFEGRVTAELKNGGTEKVDLTAGKAVALNSKEKQLKNIPLEHKFAVQAAFEEHFAYGGPLAGKDGWFDSGLSEMPIRINKQQSISYPGMGESGGKLEIGGPRAETHSPVGRRWHDRYFSMLVYPDDDFPKRLELEPATLLSFGSLAGPDESPVRLVVRKSDRHDRQSANFGLQVDDAFDFETPKRFRGVQPCLVVMRLGQDRIDLWINPQQQSLGARNAPPPNISLPRNSNSTLETLWIGDANHPTFAWYYLDALRGGGTWAEVTGE